MDDIISLVSQKSALNLCFVSLGCGRSGRGEGSVPAYPQQSASASLALDFLSYIRKTSLNFRPVSVCASAWRGWQGGGDGAGRPERNLVGRLQPRGSDKFTAVPLDLHLNFQGVLGRRRGEGAAGLAGWR